jgi:hypothetical protein
MLFTINNGNVAGCDYRQADIAHLVSSVDVVANHGYEYVFYDMNAAVGLSTAYDNLDHLGEIDWDLFFESPRLAGYCKYWQSRMDVPRYASRMETRQAEFLVYERFNCENLMRIGVINNEAAQRVEAIVQAQRYDVPVAVERDWYY